MASINEALNLVLPVRDDGAITIYAYHTPISREVFEANYRLLAATKAALSDKGVMYQMDSGPRIAALALKDEGRSGEEDDNAALSLLAELKRLTMILCPAADGWKMLPVDGAIAQGLIDADDWGEVESAIVFFTCLYALSRKATRKKGAEAMASLLSGSITSSSALDFAASLPTSTPDVPSPAAGALSVPS